MDLASGSHSPAAALPSAPSPSDPYARMAGKMRMGAPQGITSLLKEGYKHFTGLEEAILKNVEACKQLAAITRSSLGPNGMNKLVVNHLEKLFVTSDAATIVQELEVAHPAAKMIVMAAKMQEQEVSACAIPVQRAGLCPGHAGREGWTHFHAAGLCKENANWQGTEGRGG